MESKEKKLTLYYDGACHLCSKEMEAYKTKSKASRLQFVDITSSFFDAKKEGLDPKKVHKFFHVKKNNGEIYSGVRAFAEIWDTLEILRPLSAVAKSKLGNFVMTLGYLVFANLRPYLPKKKDCETCKVQ